MRPPRGILFSLGLGRRSLPHGSTSRMDRTSGSSSSIRVVLRVMMIVEACRGGGWYCGCCYSRCWWWRTLHTTTHSSMVGRCRWYHSRSRRCWGCWYHCRRGQDHMPSITTPTRWFHVAVAVDSTTRLSRSSSSRRRSRSEPFPPYRPFGGGSLALLFLCQPRRRLLL